MELNNLKPAKGSNKKPAKIIGRGQGSGKGGTATKGHKGAKSRAGYSKKIGFEGGQMPLQRRIPKFGFTNPNRKEYVVFNLGRLQEWVDEGRITDTVDVEFLYESKLVKRSDLVKILGEGELKSKLKVTAHKFSKTAKEGIEAKGGEILILE